MKPVEIDDEVTSFATVRTGNPNLLNYAFAARLPFPCEFCKQNIELHHEVADFKGTSMHRLCVSEARIQELEGTVQDLQRQLKDLLYREKL